MEDQRTQNGHIAGPERPWIPYVPNHFMVMGPSDEIDAAIATLALKYGTTISQPTRRVLPFGEMNLLACDDFLSQLRLIDPSLSDRLRSCLARFFLDHLTTAIPWVLALYSFSGGDLTVEEAVRAINSMSPCLFSDPDYITADPYTAVGSPYTAVGSPYTAVGSPCAGDGGLATRERFWEQWALDRIGVTLGGLPSLPSQRGQGVLVGVFDTSPFPGAVGSGPVSVALSDADPPGQALFWDTNRLQLWFPPFIAASSLPLPSLACPAHIVTHHGLFVAGLVKAVAPECEVHLFKVLNDYALGDLFTLSAAICDFIEHVDGVPRDGDRYPAVINLSLGVQQLDDPGALGLPEDLACLLVTLAIANCRGMVIASAAGNDSWAVSVPAGPQIPASYEYVLGVQATNIGGVRACFSNQGDVAAPGCGLMSLTTSDPITNVEYCYWNGTSFATPLVSGLAAATRGMNPGDNAHQIRDAIVAEVAASPDPTITAGIIDVPATLT